jgi:hypothetical protein
MSKQPIRDALGLGEKITFSDGTQLTCVPACLEDLEDAMQHWHVFVTAGLSIQGCYIPGNEKAKEAFEELLFIACGRKIPKEELRKKVRVADGGREVLAFIDRFLGFNTRDTGTEEKQG